MEGGGNVVIKPAEISDEQKAKLESIKKSLLSQKTQKGSLKDIKNEIVEKAKENHQTKEPEFKNRMEEIHKKTEEELVKTKKVMEALSFMGIKKEDMQKAAEQAKAMQDQQRKMMEEQIKQARRQFFKTMLIVGGVGLLVGSGVAFAFMRYMGNRQQGDQEPSAD